MMVIKWFFDGYMVVFLCCFKGILSVVLKTQCINAVSIPFKHTTHPHRDARISGDEGWWTGEVNDQVGIFPSLCVSQLLPIEVQYEELLPLGSLIGHGAFGNVHR